MGGVQVAYDLGNIEVCEITNVHNSNYSMYCHTYTSILI